MQRQATFLGLTLAIAAFSLCAVGQDAAPPKKGGTADQPQPKHDAVSRLLKTQLAAAQKVQRAALDKMQVKRIGQLLVLANDNHPDPEEAYTWSVRWLHAQRDLSETKDERIAAFANHQTRMRELREKVTTLIADTGVLLPFSAAAAADWYQAESELWLLQERGQ